MNLTYPTVDDMVSVIKEKGRGCLLFKKDLKRAYRQFPVDPADIHLLGFHWRGKIFVDRVLPMGLRTSAFVCQRVTNAITFILIMNKFSILNYLDDFGGGDTPKRALEAFRTLGKLLQLCGLEEAPEKSCVPSTSMTFVGILFNTLTLTLEITPERLQEILSLVDSWQSKRSASLKDLQSLLGKLNFISQCVRPGRIFVSRLLNWLR